MACHREIYGVLGRHPLMTALLRSWNAYLRTAGFDACMVRYTATEDSLLERLSEMFHYDRRLYVLAPDLRASIIPFLDRCELHCLPAVIVNDGGVLCGLSVSEHVLLDPAACLRLLHSSV